MVTREKESVFEINYEDNQESGVATTAVMKEISLELANLNPDDALLDSAITQLYKESGVASSIFCEHCDLTRLYVSPFGDFIYFRQLTYSSATRPVVRFNILSGVLDIVGNVNPNFSYGESFSPVGNRYSDIDEDFKTISIYDYYTNESSAITVAAGESLAADHCGYGGFVASTTWISNSILEYGVYDIEVDVNDRCTPKLVDIRKLEL